MNYKKLIIILLSFSIIIYFGKKLYTKLYTYYSPAKERTVYQTSKHNDDTIRIAFIGDSWAMGHKEHRCSIGKLIEDTLHHPVTISSYGIGGLTSKEIYNAIFEIERFKQFMRHGYDHCIICVGINDCSKKLSTTYYKKGIDCIIRFLLSNKIHPIILEIPEFDINKVYETEMAYDKLVRNLSMLINCISIDCKQEYRDALDVLIKEMRYNDKVSVIRYKSWNNDYENDLKRLYLNDGIHLNENGYSILDSMIAQTILHHYTLR